MLTANSLGCCDWGSYGWDMLGCAGLSITDGALFYFSAALMGSV